MLKIRLFIPDSKSLYCPSVFYIINTFPIKNKCRLVLFLLPQDIYRVTRIFAIRSVDKAIAQQPDNFENT